MQASRFMRKLFKNPRAISAIVPPALAEVPGGRLPYGGVFVVCATLERLCDCVLACRVLRAWARSYDRGYIVAVSWPCRGRPGVAVCLSGRGRGGRYVAAWRGCCGHGSRPSPWPWWPRRFFVSPSCGCDTPTNASVCNGFSGVSRLDLRNQLVACIVIAMSTGWPVGLATSALSLRGHGKTVDS